MRCVKVAAVAAIAMLSMLLPAEAEAQGFFSKLFGGAAQPAYQPPAPQSMATPNRAPLSRPIRERDQGDENRSSTSFSGKYRTMCVRLCDGYYWPVSYSVARSGFYRDANICRASCGGEAKLFFHASRDTDTTEMVDISGRPYALLQNAYAYRKKVVEGCACRPEPWAQSEQDRHRMYAHYEADKARARATLAGNEPFTPQKLQGPSDPAVGRAIAGVAAPVVAAVPVADAAPVAQAQTEGPVADAPGIAGPIAQAQPAGPQPAVADAGAKRRQRGQSNSVGGKQAVARQGTPRPTQANAKPSNFGNAFGLGAGGGGGKRWPGE